MLGGYADGRVMTREGRLRFGDQVVAVDKALLDTGASHGNYAGKSLIDRLVGVEVKPCSHRVKLGDGSTLVHINEYVTVEVQILDDEENLTEPMFVDFYVMPELGSEVIIGIHEILGNFYDIFTTILERARARQPAVRVERLYQLYNNCKNELCSPEPSRKKLKAYGNEAKQIGSWYHRHKLRIQQDKFHTQTERVGTDGRMFSVVSSTRFGTAYADDSVERLSEIVQQLKDFPIGQVLEAWSMPTESCPEEDETPDALAMGAHWLRYLEVPVAESREEYRQLLQTNISPDMLAAAPRVMDIMTSDDAIECFAPSRWDGLKVPPIQLDVIPGMPASIQTKARPIRPDLYAHAKKEFDRLAQYFYETDREKCTSPIASPLVIAPKATAPHIRFCGDYRGVNSYIKIPKHPIPVVQHELAKAAQFKVFLDLDMANSFHQIPLSEEASQLLSVQTPWGLVRPKFLPEGVGPASGMLQSIVKEIFNYQDFPDWTIVIFDNFLVLADDYEDAANKLEKVIKRCREFGVVLKMKKSFIGFDKVTFFGYEVTHGQWKLSDSRKAAIDALPFPKSKKEMQSFLGASLFFHNHVPDYSQWSAKLYEMTHDHFSWDPGTWQYDYLGHFERFKTCIKDACELYFPRYDLPWVVRCDASEYAVGAILFQILTLEDGTVQHQPIAFSSKRFSDPATKWDAYKREAFAIYHAVQSFSWYLRGKSFVVETDHRNLQWIETSLSPIVCRWRALLQAFDFVIRHIPGRDNKVADWMSRPAIVTTTTHIGISSSSEGAPIHTPLGASSTSDDTANSNPRSSTSEPDTCSAVEVAPASVCVFELPDFVFSQLKPLVQDVDASDPNYHNTNQPSITVTTSSQDVSSPVERSLDSVLQEVHGGRHLHFGASHTWHLAKQLYPRAKISIQAVRDYVRECPLCQKTRQTGIKGLAPQTLSLKPDTYRRTIGVDHVSVSPTDKHGNNCIILLVEHFSHYPYLYPSNNYTAETVAITLFKHYLNGGLFDQIASDPGSAFMADVVRQLNNWFGIRHKVSLVERHESNGCEATGREVLRHLKTLVMDERHYDNWSGDTVLPWIAYMLANHPTEETGGYTPFELKYGTLDATYFRLPSTLKLAPGERAHALIKELNDNLQHIRSKSLEFQRKLAEERKAKDKNVSQYEAGDLVLLSAKEKPSDHLETKLSPNWLGPYQVISQVKNDVTMKHIVLHTEIVRHVSRLKPFFGTYEDAIQIARHDQHQYYIVSINFFTGNPFVRTSMSFNVTFDDGTITMPYGDDLRKSQQFDQYINALPILFPLRFPAKVAQKEVRKMELLAITTVGPTTDAYVDFRIYDGNSSTWFDSLGLPNQEKPYITAITFTKWHNKTHREIEAVVPFFGPTHPKYKLILTAYDVMAYVHLDCDYWNTILIDPGYTSGDDKNIHRKLLRL